VKNSVAHETKLKLHADSTIDVHYQKMLDNKSRFKAIPSLRRLRKANFIKEYKATIHKPHIYIDWLYDFEVFIDRVDNLYRQQIRSIAEQHKVTVKELEQAGPVITCTCSPDTARDAKEVMEHDCEFAVGSKAGGKRRREPSKKTHTLVVFDEVRHSTRDVVYIA
jgi:hypothetical protein